MDEVSLEKNTISLFSSETIVTLSESECFTLLLKREDFGSESLHSSF